jgi:hypothetical protein
VGVADVLFAGRREWGVIFLQDIKNYSEWSWNSAKDSVAQERALWCQILTQRVVFVRELEEVGHPVFTTKK